LCRGFSVEIDEFSGRVLRVAAQDETNVVQLFGGGRRPRSEEPRIRKVDVARHFGVSEKTIERYMRRSPNPLPYEKPFAKGAVRFVMTDVERWWRQESEQHARAL
jgi:predicted DNA-binding transcriptional regulator AlpA